LFSLSIDSTIATCPAELPFHPLLKTAIAPTEGLDDTLNQAAFAFEYQCFAFHQKLRKTLLPDIIGKANLALWAA
jgi:hypothetical protein